MILGEITSQCSFLFRSLEKKKRETKDVPKRLIIHYRVGVCLQVLVFDSDLQTTHSLMNLSEKYESDIMLHEWIVTDVQVEAATLFLQPIST